jgi:ribonuclease-3
MATEQNAPPPQDAPPQIETEREALLTELERKLDLRFRDRLLLNLALQHGSFGHEGHGGRRESYERLELLGDAVLNLVVCDHLYNRYPEAPEGELAKLRARIVSEPWLARIAQTLDLGRYIRLGKGEEKAGGRNRPALLADVLEAILGAIYVDAGFGVSHAVSTRWLQEMFEELELPSDDYKSTLQELLQERERRLPRYRIRDDEGPDHAKVFVATVEAGGRVLGEGRGQSKKQAEQAAAQAALEYLRRRTERPPRVQSEPPRGQRPPQQPRVGASRPRGQPHRPGPRPGSSQGPRPPENRPR